MFRLVQGKIEGLVAGPITICGFEIFGEVREASKEPPTIDWRTMHEVAVQEEAEAFQPMTAVWEWCENGVWTKYDAKTEGQLEQQHRQDKDAIKVGVMMKGERSACYTHTGIVVDTSRLKQLKQGPSAGEYPVRRTEEPVLAKSSKKSKKKDKEKVSEEASSSTKSSKSKGSKSKASKGDKKEAKPKKESKKRKEKPTESDMDTSSSPEGGGASTARAARSAKRAATMEKKTKDTPSPLGSAKKAKKEESPADPGKKREKRPREEAASPSEAAEPSGGRSRDVPAAVAKALGASNRREFAEHMMGLPSGMPASLFEELFMHRHRQAMEGRDRDGPSLPPGPLLKRHFSALMPGIDPDHEPSQSQSRATRMLPVQSVPTG